MAKTQEKINTNLNAKAYSLLLSPIITEKTAMSSGQRERMAFRVALTTTKTQVKQAIESVFNVKVEKVRTCRYLGKVKKTARSAGRRAAFKKAYVVLAEGQSIDIVEGI